MRSADTETQVDAPGPAAADLSLTQMMRDRTHRLHARAERSGIVNALLRGKASRYSYALLMRNLVPAYQALEAGLDAHRHLPDMRGIARHELYRIPALTFDLTELFGHEWDVALPLLPAGAEYGRRVAIAAEGDGARLIAHAYTRYLGDLSGGQVLKRLLLSSPGLRLQEVSFYDFPLIDGIEDFKKHYRCSIDGYAASRPDLEMIVGEAVTAFEMNIAVSEAVHEASTVVV